MRALFAVLFLLAGCGGSVPTWSTSFDARPGGTIFLTAWRGTVRLRNSTDGKVEIAVRGEAPQPLDRLVSVEQAEVGACRILVDEAAKDAVLAIDIAAPPGASVECGFAACDVEVGGTWGRLRVLTAGTIAARVERVDSGALGSRSASVVFEAAAGPTGEFDVRTARGDVTIRLPASWNGQIDCTTAGGKLDVPPHKNLNTIWDEDKRHVVGRVGPRGRDKMLPTVWGVASQGDVSLRLEE